MGDAEVGACKINLESYKCSIKRITVSTVRKVKKGPTVEITETVTATAYDNQNAKWGRNIYLIAPPEGKKVTIRTVREGGQCPRENHKKLQISHGATNIFQDSSIPTGLAKSTTLSPKLPASTNNSTSNTIDTEIKSEQEHTIPGFEIYGVFEPFKYVSFPRITSNNITLFKYNSCKEGSFQYKIITYPDISFKLEFSIGSEAQKNKNKTSPFEKKTSSLKNVPSQLNTINTTALDVELKFSPSLTASTTYNGGKDKLEMTINFSTKEEIVHVKYKHGSVVEEYGSEFLQNISGTIKNVIALVKLIKKICEIDFLKEFTQFDATNLVNNYKPYKLKLASPNVLLSVEGQYQASKDLANIGKYLDFGIACEPLISISFTVDLLFLILNAVSAGSATGFYVMFKELDKVIGKILGDGYKKKYKDTKPFAADVYFNFIITGAINGSAHLLIDTSEKNTAASAIGTIDGMLKVDLEAGAKVSLDVFFVAVEGEASASASSGLIIKNVIETNINDGTLSYLVKGIFTGIKVKYCVKGKVGLAKTAKYGGSLADGDATLMKETELFSKQWTIF